MQFFINFFKSIIYNLILKKVDFKESTEILKVISKGVGVSWVLMDNVMLFKNKFPLPYTIKGIDVTYFNESGQNIGFMKFDEEIKLKRYSSVERTVESRMSNVTAVFNVARFALFDHVKMQVSGHSTIKLLGMEFVLPIEDEMEMHKGLVQFATDDQLEKRKKLKDKRRAARNKIKESRAKKREERKQKRLSQNDATVSKNKFSSNEDPKLPNEESLKLDQDKSYLDQSTSVD